jgi:hypothetical protein
MVAITPDSLVITLKTDHPEQTLKLLQSAIITVVDDFFSHLGNEVDVESGAAYHDLLGFLREIVGEVKSTNP